MPLNHATAAAPKGTGAPHEAGLAIERFLKAAKKPVLIEPGDDPFPIAFDTFTVLERGGALTLECWDESRNLVRRVVDVRLERPGRVELLVERFGGRAGGLTLVDMDRAANRDSARRGTRLKYRERFRHSLHRQFPDWRVVELSTEQDLHHSLSPAYPRALLRKGRAAIAAVGAAADALSPDDALSFGLIWLDYLRHREKRLAVQALALFLPAGLEHTTCHRVRYLDPKAAAYLVFVQDCTGWEQRVDPNDYTNFETRLDACRQPLGEAGVRLLEWVDRLCRVPGVERRDRPDGSVSLAVNGLEFARASGDDLLFGLDTRHAAGGETQLREIEQLARGLAAMRCADAGDRQNPLYKRHPEAWLEARIRANIEAIDATLRPWPLHGQVPQFAAGERGILDLLAVDRDGRLAVVEIKADQDIHLPLQALDYWMRVKWHLDRGEFSGRGYFPGVELRPEAPRLLLAAPALDWHPSNEAVLRYVSPKVEVERLGIGIEWKRDLKVMFRQRARPLETRDALCDSSSVEAGACDPPSR